MRPALDAVPMEERGARRAGELEDVQRDERERGLRPHDDALALGIKERAVDELVQAVAARRLLAVAINTDEDAAKFQLDAVGDRGRDGGHALTREVKRANGQLCRAGHVQ